MIGEMPQDPRYIKYMLKHMLVVSEMSKNIISIFFDECKNQKIEVFY